MDSAVHRLAAFHGGPVETSDGPKAFPACDELTLREILDSGMIVRNTSKGTELGDNVSLASSATTRNKGLLGRDGLDEGEGLWIRPCEAIHMFFMRFAIDAVFIDKAKRVTKVASHLKPWRLSASLRAHSVVELPAGTAERTNTERGDQLEIVEA